MPELLGPLGPLLAAIVLISLAIGLPVVMVLLVRFLWAGQVMLGRSKELDKLVWQLHRIASSLEQGSLSLPAQQAGTEQARAVAPVAAQPQPQPVAPAAASAPAAAATATTATPGAPGTETPPHHAGVNSMFGF